MSIFTEWPADLYRRHTPVLRSEDGGFDLDVARNLCWAAQLAYETDEPDKVKTVLGQWGWRLHGLPAGRISSVLPLTSAKGFIAGPPGVAILAFSGTDPMNIADWILDFSTHQNVNGVHAGFAAGVDAVWDEISSVLGSSGTAGTSRVFITGHSLGGALAAVAARRLLAEGVLAPDRLLGIYTYGMPRAGNGDFASQYRAGGTNLGARTYRMVHGEDLVPHVPPVESPFSFRHVGCKLPCVAGGRFDAGKIVPDVAETSPTGTSHALADVLGILRRVSVIKVFETRGAAI